MENFTVLKCKNIASESEKISNFLHEIKSRKDNTLDDEDLGVLQQKINNILENVVSILKESEKNEKNRKKNKINEKN